MGLKKPRELERPRLEEALRELYERPLLIVTAPSGYGKTTLVRNVLQKAEDLTGLWISLGREDVDDVWIWNHLCEKLKEFQPELGEWLRLLQLPRTPQEVGHIIGLIREYLMRPFCLVIDDFQECHSQALNRFLTAVVYEEIRNLHIVLISRVYPDIPYEEMFLRGYCVSVDQSMLALDREETEKIFLINGITLTKDELDRVYSYTDGWISAVYLSLHEFMRNGRLGHFTSSSHLLKTAIFDKFPALLQETYIKMSLFEHFTAEEAGYVIQTPVSSVMLIEAAEQFGFMQFEPDTGRFIMHALLRTVAFGELERAGLDKNRLYNRGGEWSENNGDYVQALLCYRNAGNREAVFRLLSDTRHNNVIETAPVIVRNIFSDTPVEIKAKYPVAWLSFIYNSILREEVTWSSYLYQEAKNYYGQNRDLDMDYRRLDGELLILQAFLDYNDMEKMNRSMREAYELLDREPSGIFRQTLLTSGAPYMTMCYYNSPGSLKQVVELEKDFARYHTRLVGRGEGDWDDQFDAEYAMVTCDMENALRLAVQAGERAVARGQECMVVSSFYIQCRCLIYFGRVQELAQKVREFHGLIKESNRSMLITDYELAISYLYACLGRRDNVAGWVRGFDLEQCGRVVRNSRSGCITYGMLLCKAQQWHELDGIADKCIVPYENMKHNYAVIRGYIFKAIASWQLDSQEKAREYLHRALALAEPDGIRIPFVENCVELMPVMEGLESRFCNTLKPHVRQYLRSLKLFAQETRQIVLTKREQELMALVKEGLRNADISSRLNIALVTVEKSLTSVYRKLSVSNRAAAIAKMEEMDCV